MSDTDDALKKLIRERLEAIEPPAEAIAAIRHSGTKAHRKAKNRRRVIVLSSFAAAATVIFGTVQFRSQSTAKDAQKALAAQISAVHRHHPAGKYQFESTEFTTLETTLQEIGFSFAEAEKRIRERFDLSGCSYCKVIADLAIHFNARERNTGRQGSFYIAALTPELAAVSSSRAESAGVELEFWDDGERFFIFASNAVP